MIEKVILDYLTTSLSVPVYMEQPDDQTREFVLIQLIGASKTDRLRTSTLQFTVFGASMYRAAFLCDQLTQVMDAVPEHLDSISRSHYGGSYNATFTAEKTYRYRATYELTHY